MRAVLSDHVSVPFPGKIGVVSFGAVDDPAPVFLRDEPRMGVLVFSLGESL